MYKYSPFTLSATSDILNIIYSTSLSNVKSIYRRPIYRFEVPTLRTFISNFQHASLLLLPNWSISYDRPVIRFKTAIFQTGDFPPFILQHCKNLPTVSFFMDLSLFIFLADVHYNSLEFIALYNSAR